MGKRMCLEKNPSPPIDNIAYAEKFSLKSSDDRFDNNTMTRNRTREGGDWFSGIKS